MLNKLYEYEDSLAILNQSSTLQDKLTSLHEVITTTFDFIDRIAIAVYEPKTDLLKTFVTSCHGENTLKHYQAKLSDAPSLKEILQQGRPRVVNDLDIFSSGNNIHTLRIAQMEFAASYSMPIYQQGQFFGFVFFNSRQKEVFHENVLHQMDVFGHMISLMVMNELSVAYTLKGALKTSQEIVKYKDPGTGSHIDRMAGYAKLIATELADCYQLSDEYIEKVFLFSPLHDIGKVGIPDSILLKKGSLTEEEYDLMKTHTHLGRLLIDQMLENFGLDGFQHASILRNIAEYHHEAVNGSGYPHGLKGDEIPLEARIVAVADIFDALTSERPYKKAWSNQQAFEALNKMVGSKLDDDCVRALVDNEAEILKIQHDYQEDSYN
jgi:HD-GYP domain-containing protein (c-di-GMP phosphodiesterase class II)